MNLLQRIRTSSCRHPWSGPAARITVLGLFLAGCSEREPLPGPYYMTDKPEHAVWDLDGFSGGFFHELEGGVLTIRQGEPISVVRYTGLPPEQLPLVDYEIAWEARRTQGHDFFSAITFPVGSLETCLTAVIGGWGGKKVGFSSIDEQDASENPYSTEREFVNGRWYHFRLDVRADRVSLWIDGGLAATAPVAGRSISLRPGDIEFSAPLGFATYFTEAEIRHVVLRHLRPPAGGL